MTTDTPHHADKVRQTAESRDALSPLAASWRRSLNYHGLSPEHSAPPERVTQAELKQVQDELGGFLAVAQPTLDRLFGAVGSSGCCVLLTDRTGIVLDRRGAANDDETFNAWGLWTGAVWSEAAEGTNGIGTCLAEERAVAIHRDQHFHSRNTAMSCIDAPIFDHEGRMIAALDVSSCRADQTESVTTLIQTAVADAARRIESDHFRSAFPDARIVMGEGHGPDGAVLLAVDGHDLVVGATRAARRTFDLSSDSFSAPRPVADVLSGVRQKADLKAAERAELQRALARSGGNVSEAARDLGIGRATLYRRMNRLGLT